MSALTAGGRPVIGKSSFDVSVNGELKSLYDRVLVYVSKIC